MRIYPAGPVLAAVLAALLLGSTPPSAAQESFRSVAPGPPARIASGLVPSRTATPFRGAETNTLLAVGGSGSYFSPFPSLSENGQRQVARKDRLQGAWIGGSVGALVGGVGFATINYVFTRSSPRDEYILPSFVLGAGVGAVLGALIGGVIGAGR